MSWVCTNCSTSNDDTATSCAVCGMSRSSSSEVVETEESKIFFSNFDAFKYAIKKMFSKSSAPKKEKKADRRTESLPPPATSDSSETTKAKKPRKPLFGSAYASPWPEHKIEFDKAVIQSKGFVRSERETLNGVNGYMFYREVGTSQFIRVEMALIQKMARKI